eukprot:3742127-Pleurochrysis_carterae.AAC.1
MHGCRFGPYLDNLGGALGDIAERLCVSRVARALPQRGEAACEAGEQLRPAPALALEVDGGGPERR